MEGESGVIWSIIDELHSWHIQRDQMEGESCVTEVSLMNFFLEISKQVKWNVKVVLPEVLTMNFILGISKEIKCKVKKLLLEVSFMNFALRISKEIKWKDKVVLP